LSERESIKLTSLCGAEMKKMCSIAGRAIEDIFRVAIDNNKREGKS